MESFREIIPLTSGIKSILDSYTFGNGNLRELLQNSDDAGATEQTFILDKRTYGTDTLVDKELASTQGPALISHNNTLFTESDWKAVKTIHGSSKVENGSQTGKYGIGFRSAYHITDTPQILSGDSLVIFDPHDRFAGPRAGGVRLHSSEFNLYGDQLQSFQSVTPELPTAFNGTAIRLPLRTVEDAERSEIKPHVSTSSEDMQRLLTQFTEQELPLSLLFLRHLLQIEIRMIDEEGDEQIIGSAMIADPDTIARSRTSPSEGPCPQYTMSIIIRGADGTETTRRYLLHQARDPENRVEEIIGQEFGAPVLVTLRKEKLLPYVTLAAPLDGELTQGRLFTLLPLPIATGFPLHVNSVFALTPDRQNLRKKDAGLVPGSREHLCMLWNEYLFQHLIPRAWAELIHALPRYESSLSVFNMLAPLAVDSSDSASYWIYLARDTLQAAIEHNFAVWPVYAPEYAVHETGELVDLLIVPAELLDDVDLLGALAMAGLRLLVVPPIHRLHMLEIVCALPRACLLDPLSASSVFKFNHARLSSVSNQTKRIVLDYLASTGSVAPIQDLPIIPLVGGGHTSLYARTTLPLKLGPQMHILADDDIALIFSAHIPYMIDTTSAAMSRVMRLHLHAQRDALNVRLISMVDVSDAMVKATRSFDVPGCADEVDVIDDKDETVPWLIRLWNWVDAVYSCSAEYVHCSEIAACSHVLPTSRGTLRRMSSGGINHRNLSPASEKALSVLCVPVLHPKLPNMLGRGGVQFNDVAFVLTHAQPLFDDVLRPEVQAFLTECIESGVGGTPATRQLLRSFPIFSILARGTREHSRLDNLPPVEEQVKIIAVEGSALDLLPELPGTLFIDASDTNTLQLARFIEPGNHNQPDNCKMIMGLALEHFGQQSHEVRAYYKALVLRHLMSLNAGDPSGDSLRDALRSLPVVPVHDGTVTRAPHGIIDPIRTEATALLNIYPKPHIRVASDTTPDSIRQLSYLGLFTTVLTAPLAIERLNELASTNKSDFDQRNAHAYATRLVHLLSHSSPHLITACGMHLSSRWLPVTLPNRSLALRAPIECWDDGTLCDQVLGVVYAGPSIALRKALGWNSHISMSIVTQQFLAILDNVSLSDRSTRMEDLVCYLSKRFPGGSLLGVHPDLAALCDALGERAWVPSSSGQLVHSARAIVSQDSNHCPPFHRVADSLRTASSILLEMGCLPRLDNHLIAAALQSCHQLDHALALLSKLEIPIEASCRDSLLIPTASQQRQAAPLMRGISSVFFNNHGHALVHTNADGKLYAAHPRLSRELAVRLQLRNLSDLLAEGIRVVDEDDDDDDFSQKVNLTTMISAVLKDYSIEHSLNEFVANADDAGASGISFLIDENEHAVKRSSRLLTPQLAKLRDVKGPSLVIHNDAVFTDRDFVGFRDVARGSKTNDVSKIGRMGLGSLCMYHWTDNPEIVTGGSMMWLDPGGESLPRRNSTGPRRGFRTSVASIHSQYPSHLDPFNGLFGFQDEDNHYEGTMFRLPLRVQTNSGSLSDTTFSAFSMDDKLQKYYELARQSIFFTSSVASIQALRRTRQGAITHLWSVTRDELALHADGLSQIRLRLRVNDEEMESETWLIASSDTALPDKFAPLRVSHRVSATVSCALAGQLSHGAKNGRDRKPSRLFATLPLPGTLELPVHVQGAFVPAQNRRGITLLPESALEAQYNQWILTEPVPHLYLKMCSEILSRSRILSVMTWWPVYGKGMQDIPRLILHSAEESILTTEEKLCRSVTGRLLPPKDAVFIPHAVDLEYLAAFLRAHKASEVVSPFPFPLALQERLPRLMPIHVKNLLSGTASTITQAAAKSLRELDAALRFFELDSSEKLLLGLKVLPTRDGMSAVIPSISEPALYVTQDPIADCFPPSRFVSEAMAPLSCIQLFIDSPDINVVRLDGAGVRELLLSSQHHTARPSYVIRDSDRDWLRSLWPHLTRELLESHLSDLPLIPTTSGTTYISLESLRKGRYLNWRRADTRDSLIAAAEAFGILIVDCLFLESGVPAPASLLTALRESRLFVVGTEPGWEMLSSFLRQHTVDSADQGDSAYFAGLPLWRTFGYGGTARLESSRGISMLPLGLRESDILPFMPDHARFSEYSLGLEHLLRTRTTFNSPERAFALPDLRTLLTSRLAFPVRLAVADVPRYVHLLRLSRGIIQDMRVPDGNGTMKHPGDLHDPDTEVFVAAFATQALRLGNFPHPLVELMIRERVIAVKSQLDAVSAMRCAIAIDSQARDGSPDALIERATVVYQAINQLGHGELASMDWRQLVSLRFIPRSSERLVAVTHQTPLVQSLGRPLPDIVSLNDLTLPTDDGYALWSQRAMFLEAPLPSFAQLSSQRRASLCASVVDHLLALTAHARNCVLSEGPDQLFIRRSVTSSYKWLEERAHLTEVASGLHTLRTAPIFLNVTDPAIDDWACNWRTASQLVIGSHYDDSGRNKYTVLDFLGEYPRLLLAAGAQKVDDPIFRPQTIEASPKSLQHAFDDFRKKGRQIDLHLATKSGVSSYPVHSVYMSTVFPHFADLWDFSITSNQERPIPFRIPGITEFSLRSIIDYAYTGTLPLEDTEMVTGDTELASEKLEDLLDLLEMCNVWDIPELRPLVESAIVTTYRLILPQTVRIVRDRAAFARADNLRLHCEKYIEQNRDLLEPHTDSRLQMEE